jgi:ferritin-like metal-binding protein YciE
MLTRNNNFREEAYAGDELHSNDRKKLERRCMLIEQTVQDGTFTLQQALIAYKISIEDYKKYRLEKTEEEIEFEFEIKNTNIQGSFSNETRISNHHRYKYPENLDIDIHSERNLHWHVHSFDEIKNYLTESLCDVLWTEKYLCKELPKLTDLVSDPVSHIFERSISSRKKNIIVLEEVFKAFGLRVSAKKSASFPSFLEDAKKRILTVGRDDPSNEINTVTAVRRFYHYNITTYESLIGIADGLGKDEAVNLLLQPLNTEKSNDQELQGLSGSAASSQYALCP